MKKIILSIIVVYSLLLTACPQSSVQKVEAANKKIAVYADSAVGAVRSLYRSNLISLAQKDKLADALIYLAQGGAAVDAEIARLKTGGNAGSGANLRQLLTLFRSGIVNRFIAVLEQMKLVSLSAELKTAISLIQTNILLIADLIGAKSETLAAIKGVS